MSSFAVGRTDPDDDDALTRWHEVERASVRAEDADAPHRSLEALAASVQHPSDYRAVELYAAHDERTAAGGGRPVGVAELSWSTAEDLDLVRLEIHVLPARRREGAGRALWRVLQRRRSELGRAVAEAELAVAPAAEGTAPAGPAFAEALGFRVVHTEDHLVLGLPPDPAHVERLTAQTLERSAGYDVLSWRGRCPDEHVAAWSELRTAMEAAAPSGDSSREPIVWDAARVRSSEQRMSRSYDVLVAAVRPAPVVGGGQGADAGPEAASLVGYSMVFCERDGPQAWQDDTFVLPDHRGRRLGTLLKLATLDMLTTVTPRTSLHTWTAPGNEAMQAINRSFGFRPVAQSVEVQWRDRTSTGPPG